MTVGVNISHDSSICIKTEESIEFYEESRFNKQKYWEPSLQDWDYKSFNKIKNFNDVFVFTSFGRDNKTLQKLINASKMSNPYTGMSNSDDHFDSKLPPPINGDIILCG